MKCPNCGGEGTGKFCEYCGSELPKSAPDQVVNDNSQTVINNYYYGGTPVGTQTVINSANSQNVSSLGTNRTVMIILTVFFGYLGIQYFLTNRIGMGLLYLFTFGLCGVGYVVDIVRVATGTFPGMSAAPVVSAAATSAEASTDKPADAAAKSKKTIAYVLLAIGIVVALAGRAGGRVTAFLFIIPGLIFAFKNK